LKKSKSEAALTRAAILDAAERTFYRKGVKESSLEDIAVEAGVTRGALYWHFRGKAHLLLELFTDTYLIDLQTLIEDDTIDVHSEPIHFIESRIIKWLNWLGAEPRLKRLSAILLRINGYEDYDELRTLVKDLDDREEILMKSAFRSASELGQLGKGQSPALCCYTMRSLLKGIQLEIASTNCIDDSLESAKGSIRSLILSFRQDVQ